MPSYYLIDVDSLKTKEAYTLTWIDDPLCIGESRSGVSTCYRQKTLSSLKNCVVLRIYSEAVRNLPSIIQ